jgi:SNF2 family DNA or RNA helicase
MSDHKLPDNFKHPDEIALELVQEKNKKENLELELDFIDDEAEPIDEELAAYEAQIKEIQEKAREARTKKFKLQEKKNSLKYNLSLTGSNISNLQNALHKAQMELLKVDEMNKREQELDEYALTQHWFSAIKTHQFEAAKQMTVIGGRAILADKRGLGKSLTALATADLLKAQKIVVISKGEILRNFAHEVKKWAPNRRMLSIVSENKSYRDTVLEHVFPIADQWILLVNFESWWRDKALITKIVKLQPDTVIVDEAHNAKEIEKNNFRGLQSLIYAKNKCPKCESSEIVLLHGPDTWQCTNCYHKGYETEFYSVKNSIQMTGSPIMNKPEDFYPLLYLIDRKQFPSKKKFLYDYCAQEEYTNLMGKTAVRWTFRYGGSSKLLNSIGPQFIQRDRKTAGVEIPDQEIQYHNLEFDREKYPRQWKAYRDLVAYTGALFDKDDKGYIVATQASSLITRWRQVISWPMGIKIESKDQEGNRQLVFQCDVDESVKIDRAFDLANEFVREGERVVIFSKFTAPLEELKRRFDATLGTDEKLRAAIYYGKTPINEREHIKQDFDASTYVAEDYDYDIVLCQYQAAGEGLNFNTATQMIFIEREWNPEKEGQATGRIQRMGQTKETTVHVLQLEKTIDTQIEALLADKGKLVGDFENNAELIRQILEQARRNT